MMRKFDNYINKDELIKFGRLLRQMKIDKRKEQL